MSDCNHDLEKPVRKGRHLYRCRKCNADITLYLFMIACADLESEKLSNCCGASPIGASEDMGMCPECKEHCEYEEVEP